MLGLREGTWEVVYFNIPVKECEKRAVEDFKRDFFHPEGTAYLKPWLRMMAQTAGSENDTNDS